MSEDWKGAYRAAVLETDHHKLMDKIDSAVSLLRTCLLEVRSSPKQSGEAECIADALRTLQIIRRIELRSRLDAGEAASTKTPYLRPNC
jgi:hypothetical protein